MLCSWRAALSRVSQCTSNRTLLLCPIADFSSSGALVSTVPIYNSEISSVFYFNLYDQILIKYTCRPPSIRGIIGGFSGMLISLGTMTGILIVLFHSPSFPDGSQRTGLVMLAGLHLIRPNSNGDSLFPCKSPLVSFSL